MIILACVGGALYALAWIILKSKQEFWYHKYDDDPRARYIRKIRRLADAVWKKLKADLRHGTRQRGHTLTIMEIYEIVPQVNSHQDAVDDMRKKANVHQVYHGTTYDAAKSIITNGFRLPSKTTYNMFGPGVYFAGVPQKSYDYTDESGMILICDAALGKQKKIYKAKFLDPDKDLETSRLWGLWKTKYDSAHAVAGASTISDEYIVFNPARIIPRYIITTTTLW